MAAVRTRIHPVPVTLGDKPYSHLMPIVEALIAGGNHPVRAEIFYLDRDGWRADFKEPLDFQLLREKFDFPETIILSPTMDKIYCKNSWVEIQGGMKP